VNTRYDEGRFRQVLFRSHGVRKEVALNGALPLAARASPPSSHRHDKILSVLVQDRLMRARSGAPGTGMVQIGVHFS